MDWYRSSPRLFARIEEECLRNILKQQAKTKLIISEMKLLKSPNNDIGWKLTHKAHVCELLICNSLIARKQTHEIKQLLHASREARNELINYGRSHGVSKKQLQIYEANSANKSFDYEHGIEILWS